jgi:hypothetical protein
MSFERVKIVDAVKDPGPPIEDPGPRPADETVEVIRAWEEKALSFGDWARRNRRFQLAQNVKKFLDVPAERRSLVESTLVLVGTIVLANEAVPKNIFEEFGLI